MPELPEVQTIVSDLQNTVVGKQIVDINVIHKKLVAGVSADEFIHKLIRTTIKEVERHGKYILMSLEKDISLLIHLKVTGGLFYFNDAMPSEKYLGLCLEFHDGSYLNYHDKWRWGRFYLYCHQCVSDLPQIRCLGPDLMKGGISAARFYESLSVSSSAVHSWLLNQQNIAGLGNIYVNEGLYRAGILPTRRCNTLSKSEVVRLYEVLLSVMAQAISCRGTTFSDYRDLFGHPGKFQTHLQVFKRADQTCTRCGHTIERSKLGGRSIFYCGECQL
jgi:formamidopyrimidine-DNA glycosylase